ncbi:MAG: hypothetical protein R3B40_02220 [Polyangiales bacterium]|nr:hypothetical protein [Myxococcales bacterium]MCB9657113.1 hypothetical protein [Sandaracinaceae bacterium]
MWRRSKSARARFTGATLALVATGCVRPPLDPGCVQLGPGDLVVSELRGPQSGTDTRGQWIEVYNASAGSVALTGVQVVLRPLAASASTITVRDAQLSVASGDYVVLAVDTTCSSDTCVTRLPADADYGFGRDYTRDLPSGAIVELRSCGALVDSLLYRALPSAGTLALSGSAPPDANDNDVASDDAGDIVPPFCADDEPNTPPGTETEIGLAGTPGTANRVCP